MIALSLEPGVARLAALACRSPAARCWSRLSHPAEATSAPASSISARSRR